MRQCAVCGERGVMDGTSSKAVRAQGLDLCNRCMDVAQVRSDRAAVLGGGTERPQGASAEESGEEKRAAKLAIVLRVLESLEGDEVRKDLLLTWRELRELIRDGLR